MTLASTTLVEMLQHNLTRIIAAGSVQYSGIPTCGSILQASLTQIPNGAVLLPSESSRVLSHLKRSSLRFRILFRHSSCISLRSPHDEPKKSEIRYQHNPEITVPSLDNHTGDFFKANVGHRERNG